VFLFGLLLKWDELEIWSTLMCVIVPIFLGVWGIFSRRQILNNQVTGTHWEVRKIIGRETSQKRISGLEILTLDVPIPRPFVDPFSTVAIGSRAKLPGPRSEPVYFATRVFESTLIGLWVSEWIEIRRMNIHHSYFRVWSSQNHEYRLFPGKSASLHRVRFSSGADNATSVKICHSETPQGSKNP
jgi:hypothetical protein